MDLQNNHSAASKNKSLPYAVGAVFISVGVLVLLGQYFNNLWALLAILPAVGMVFLIKGTLSRQMGFTIPGALVTGGGVGLVFSIGVLNTLPVVPRIGIAFICFALGWVYIALAARLFYGQTAWWALLAGAPFASMGVCLAFSPLRWVDYVFYPVLGIGLAFLIWGVVKRLMGLIIPGCLLVGIGPGIFLGWKDLGDTNGLTETGVMLVCFAIGWALITFFSKLVYQKFIWWPLIPGGVLAVVGWGLYIGGSPDNALGFIGNTGSIGLIIFGLYLLLLRRGIHQ
jgi:uncharacterized membrane protein